MKTNIISKEIFLDCIKTLQDLDAFQNGLNDYYHAHNVDGYLYYPDGSVTILNLLHNIFHDDDEWIDYFCCDLEYGNNYEPGCVTEYDGTEIPLVTAEDLYNLLIENMEENE